MGLTVFPAPSYERLGGNQPAGTPLLPTAIRRAFSLALVSTSQLVYTAPLTGPAIAVLQIRASSSVSSTITIYSGSDGTATANTYANLTVAANAQGYIVVPIAPGDGLWVKSSTSTNSPSVFATVYEYSTADGVRIVRGSLATTSLTTVYTPSAGKNGIGIYIPPPPIMALASGTTPPVGAGGLGGFIICSESNTSPFSVTLGGVSVWTVPGGVANTYPAMCCLDTYVPNGSSVQVTPSAVTQASYWTCFMELAA